MIYLLDDFHNIQTVRLPGASMKLSLNAIHMASNLLDIHQIVPAILLFNERSKIHRMLQQQQQQQFIHSCTYMYK